MSIRGLGAFIDGGLRGYQFAEGVDSRKKDRERRERLDQMELEDRDRLHRRQDEADAWARESRARTRTDWQRADRERARAEADREFLTGLHGDVRDMYDAHPAGRGVIRPASASVPVPQRETLGVGPQPSFSVADAPEGRGAIRPMQPEPAPTAGLEAIRPVQAEPAPEVRRVLPPAAASGAIPRPQGLGAVRSLQAEPEPEGRGVLRPVPSERNKAPRPRAADADPLAQNKADIQGYLADVERDRQSPMGAIRPRQAPRQPAMPGLGVRPSVDVNPEAGTRGILRDQNTPSAEILETALPGRGTRQGEVARRGQTIGRDYVDFYRKEGAPHIVEQLLRRGMVQEASLYQEWIDREETRAGMDAYGRAAFFASVGDFNRFSQAVLDLYNNEDYFPDGLVIDQGPSGFIVDQQTGQIAGARIVFQDAQGNRFEETWDSMDELVHHTLTMLAPERAFETRLAQMASANDMRADEIRREREFVDFMRREVVKRQKPVKTPEEMVGDAIAELAQDQRWFGMTDEQKRDAILQKLSFVDEIARSINEGVQRPVPAPLRR